MSNPLISVIMSVYNTDIYLNYAIESILNQSFSNFEFIIIDDGSTDKTSDILDYYKKKDSRIIVVHKENSGISDSLNLAISMARSRFLARQDPDDVSMLSRLEKQIKFMLDNPEIDMVGTNNFVIDSENNIINIFWRPQDVEEINKFLPQFNPICHGSILVKKDAIIKCGLYDPSFDGAEDYELWFRMKFNDMKLANLSDFLYLWRIHPGSMAGSKLDQQKKIVASVFRKYNIDFRLYNPKVFNSVNRPLFKYWKSLIKGYLNYYQLKLKRII